MPDHLSRRTFLQKTGRAAALGAAISTTARSASAVNGANDRLRLGFIGCGIRGPQLLEGFQQQVPSMEVAACCDLKRSRAERFKGLAGPQCETYSDFRKLVERKDLDAVVIAVNGHWHCLPVIHACAAGKHVYAEKPLAWSIGEGRVMVNAARKYDRIVYFGAQQRHMPHYQDAVELIQSGKLGRITQVRSWNVENIAPEGFGSPPDGAPPADLDWDFWLGPAPKVPYNPNRYDHHYWFWEYGGGWQSEWGVHHNDVVRWAMKADVPLSVASSGGKWARKDNAPLPDTLDVLYEFPEFLYIYTFRHCNGRPIEGLTCAEAFYGENGTLVINRSAWAVYPEYSGPDKPRMKPIEKVPSRGEYHQKAFADAVRAGKVVPGCDIEEGQKSSVLGHLSNISFRVGRKIHWDAQAEQVKNDAEANKLVSRVYREPWKLEV